MRPWCKAGALAMCLFLAVGCAERPGETFAELKTAALERDADTIWQHIDPATRETLAVEASGYFETTPPAGGATALEGSGRDALEYLSGLVAGLGEFELEYIRSLGIREVVVDGDVATLTLRSLRARPPARPLIFKKVEGRWLWDAREVLEMYHEHRRGGSYGGF